MVVQIGEILPTYPCRDIGAPFNVMLISSAVRRAGDSIVIPDINGMIAGISLARLWRNERLSGKDLLFLRKAARLEHAAFEEAIGGAKGDIEAYETGPRPMTLALEKYIRVYLFNKMRCIDSPRVDEMLNFLEWTAEEWKPAFQDLTRPIEIWMQHFPTGWQEVGSQPL